jgi:hypothetical protein
MVTKMHTSILKLVLAYVHSELLYVSANHVAIFSDVLGTLKA